MTSEQARRGRCSRDLPTAAVSTGASARCKPEHHLRRLELEGAEKLSDVLQVPHLDELAVARSEDLWPDIVIERPVGGMPRRSRVPVCVPDMVQRPVTRSSCSTASVPLTRHRVEIVREQPLRDLLIARSPHLEEPSPVELDEHAAAVLIRSTALSLEPLRCIVAWTRRR